RMWSCSSPSAGTSPTAATGRNGRKAPSSVRPAPPAPRPATDPRADHGDDRMFRPLIAGVALALCLAAQAEAREFSAERLSDGIRVLASDAFGGRYPGTEGETLTLEWLQGQYEAMGLQPGGLEGRWLQA